MLWRAETATRSGAPLASALLRARAMKIAFTLLLVLHGVIHLMGFAKAFRLAELRQLELPISRPLGALWLAAALAFCATAVAVHVSPGSWWIVGAVAIPISQIVIISSWSDAKFGSVANVVALAGVVFGFGSRGPTSLHAAYVRDVETSRSPLEAPPLVTEADLARLPRLVARYLRVTGAVGQPRIVNFVARFRGKLRSGPDAAWMDIDVVQSTFHTERTRLFFLDASMFGIPFEAYHRYRGPSASMRVKVASLFPIVDASGPEMSRAETVTFFNDMCLLAPATLLDPDIHFREVDAHTVEATFTNAGNTIRADLSFHDGGELASFSSDDRTRASPDGKSFESARWVTPVHSYRAFGARRLMGEAEARWQTKDASFDYARFTTVDVVYNVGVPR